MVSPTSVYSGLHVLTQTTSNNSTFSAIKTNFYYLILVHQLSIYLDGLVAVPSVLFKPASLTSVVPQIVIHPNDFL